MARFRAWLGRFTPRFTRRMAVVALALLLGCLAANQKAEAGCGHYVRKLGAGFVPGKTPARLANADIDNVHLPEEVLASPHRCTGPECQGLPLGSLPVTPALPAMQTTHEGAVMLPPIEPASQIPGSWQRETLHARPLAGFRQLPDRPPNG